MNAIFDKAKRPSRGILRLFIAIVISVLLHFFWLKDFNWTLPKSITERQVIDARLVEIQPTPIKQKQAPNQVMNNPQPETTTVTEKTSELPILNTDAVSDRAPELTNEEPLLESVQSGSELAEEPLDALPPVELEQPTIVPYQYIDTTFDIYLYEDKTRAGGARITYDATEVGRYQLNWSIEATGLMALFYPNLVQTSEGLIVAEQGLRPLHYRYQFGDKANKSYQADFDWTQNQLLLHSTKDDKTVELTQNAQDYLSFMYQFMFQPPLNAMQISLTNGKRLASYEYTFEGEETLTLDFGEVKTYHIKHVRSDSDEKTELWLAIDYQYIPVKISKTEKDGQVIHQIAKIIYTKPVQLIQELPLP